METIKLRTSTRPTAFLGTEIFADKTEEVDARYTLVRIFENYTDGGYVVGIRKVTYWSNEEDEYEVTMFQEGNEVGEFIKNEIPDLDLENLPDMTKKIEPEAPMNEWAPRRGKTKEKSKNNK